jgi:hypothetical protein
VQAIREGPALSRAHDQLKACLAVAVFEILATQSMTMHTKKQAAPGTRDDRDLLGDIGTSRAGQT